MSYACGDCIILVDRCLILCNGKETKVAPKSMDLLMRLSASQGEVCMTEDLLEDIWRGSLTPPNAVYKSIGELRAALGDTRETHRYIETVPKRGYRLMIPLIAEQVESSQAKRFILRRPRALAGSVAAVTLVVLLTFIMSDPRVVSNTEVPLTHPAVSVSVMPFDSANGDADAFYLAERFSAGIAEKLSMSNRVTLIPFEALQVPSSQGQINVDHLVKGHVRRSQDRIHIELQLQSTKPSELLYQEVFTRDSDQFLVLENELLEPIANAIKLHLDPFERRAMLEHGTSNAHAYLAVKESHRLFGQPNPSAVVRAIELLNTAIELDPQYVNAHVRLIFAYGGARFLIDRQRFPQLVAEIDRLVLHLSEIADPDDPILPNVRGQVSDDIAVFEENMRELIIRGESPEKYLGRCGTTPLDGQESPDRNPSDCQWVAYSSYASILAAANLPNLAAAFLERIRIDGGEKNIWATGAGPNIAELLIGPEVKAQLVKRTLEANPANVLALNGLIDALTKLGRHEEAGHYLEELHRYDEGWGVVSDYMRRAQRAGIELGSTELEEFLDNPIASEVSKACVLLILGDVERGAAFMRNANPSHLAYFTLVQSLVEVSFPEHVKTNPTYLALLDEMGIGEPWRQFLIEKVNEMEPYTGIRYPATVSVSVATMFNSK